MLKLLPALCIIALLLYSCGNTEVRRGRVNLFADAGRTNSYEHFGTFNSMMRMEVDLKAREGEPRISLKGAIAPPLVLTSDLLLLAGADGNITKVIADRVKWQLRLPNNSVAASAMVADAHWNMYLQCSDGVVRSYDTSGNLRWEHQLSAAHDLISYSDLLMLSGRLIAADSRGSIHCIDTTGKLKWNIKTDVAAARVPAGDSSGNLLLFVTHNRYGASDSLNKYDDKGALLWSRPFAETRLFKGPVVVNDMVMVAGLKQHDDDRVPVMHVLDRMGRVLWSRELPATPRGLSAADDGSIFVTSYDAAPGDTRSYVSAFDPEGREIWNRDFNFTIRGPVLVSRSVIAFTGTKKNSATGLYLMGLDGDVREIISLSNMPIINLHAAAGNNADVIYAMSEKLGYVAIGQSTVQRLLPF